MKKIISLTLSIFLSLIQVYAQDVYQADVIVYGGTSSAITTAVQVAKMQKSVIVVSPDLHLGGLSAGGLGDTDSGDKGVIGGLSREFYHRIYQYYQKDENWVWQGKGVYDDTVAWLFEPHIAEQVFEDFVDEYQVQVYRSEWLDRSLFGIVMENGEIQSIRTLSGKTFKGKIFIDATYEGDLMALANVDYHVGREANSVYGEQWNGIQVGGVLHNGHHFKADIDPYIIPGDPDSGVLPKISTEAPGIKGDGDDRLQAYCFRMCLSNHPYNRVPFPEPQNYDPFQYELLARVFASGLDENIAKFSGIPNRKTDTNNMGPFSTDNIGMNYDYPEATYERRREIIKEHEDYQKGLMYFLANDEKVPEEIRDYMSQWGLAADEFTDNGNWPHQIYVREARRMIGEFVMTENEILGKAPVNRSIGMGSYTMDSHNVQRYIKPDGFVQNEGIVRITPQEPYQIDFGAILPKKEQCSNLLVPVCASSTHIAFGSIRMEPVFMILGQSAGTVAGMALEQGIKIHDLKYEDLREVLLNDGQILGQDIINQPPVASFTYDRYGYYEVSFDATASGDPDGTIVSWIWDFGDGQTATGETATHTYPAVSSSYTVTLTVTDDDDATGSFTQYVTPLDMNSGNNNLIGHWTLDQSSNDFSGNNYHGTIMNGAGFTSVCKEGSHALELNGINQYIDLGTPEKLPTGRSSRSLSLWARTNNISDGYRFAASFGKPSSSNAMFVGQYGPNLLGGGYGNDVVVQNFWKVGIWHHIVLTYDGTTAKMYADGIEIASQPKNWNLIAEKAFIGRQVNVREYWDGAIDDVRIYDKALSLSEIQELAIGQDIINQPPVASFTYDRYGYYEVSFDATASGDPDGTIVSWIWDFGDGQTATGETATHTYPAVSSSYTVTLTVTDDDDATGSFTQYVTPLDMNSGNNNLIGHWTLDQSSNDFSGNNYHGTIMNGAGFTSVCKEGSHALELNGINQYIDLGTPEKLPTGRSSRSLSLWARTNNISDGYRFAASFGKPSSSNAMFVGQYGPNLLGGGYGNDVVVQNFWKVGIWHHIVLTYDGTTAKMYADGIEIASQPKNWNLIAEKAFIGRQVNVREYWDGAIDDVRIYDKALSLSEIQELAIGQDIINQPPVASFTYDRYGYYEVSFDATASGDPDGTIVSWIWDFGDGQTATGETATHTYPAVSSSYTVTLTVTDDDDATGSFTQYVTPLDMNSGNNNLIGHWTLDQSSNDFSGNNYHGTIMNGAGFTSVCKEGSHALELNGINQYIDLGTPEKLPTGRSSRSLSLWARTNNISDGYRFAASFGKPSSSNAMFVGQYGPNLLGGGYGNDVVVQNFWKVGIWHHIVLTYDGTTAKMYADGIEIASQPKNWNLIAEKAFIGRQVNVREYWDGAIDDVRVYNKVLSIGEIQKLAIDQSNSQARKSETGTFSLSYSSLLDSPKVYPNPVRANLIIEIPFSLLNSDQSLNFKLIDLMGNIVKDYTIDRSGQIGIDVTELKNAMYLCFISSNDQVLLRNKLLKLSD